MAGGIAFRAGCSPDAVGALEFADVGNDRRNVPARQPLERRHVPEGPVMSDDTLRHRMLWMSSDADAQCRD